MISLRRLTIPKKIVAITMIISASALLVASGALVGYDYITARRDLTAGSATLAQIVADNATAAVSFNDRAVARDILNGLRAESSIITACIYSDAGLFAAYSAAGVDGRCPERPALNTEARDSVVVSRPIELKGKDIGSVQLRATVAPVYARLRLEIAAIGGILVISALFAFGLSAGLQKLISEPILSLARTAATVSQKKDYSIRAGKQSEDELGTLVDSFNDMLAQIQAMVGEIRARETDLEERTAELATANEELRSANKMKDEFLATLSHELRTPLTSIFGWINLLQEGKLDEPKAQKAIEVIARNARAQTQIVDDLLNVSQIITGKLKVHPEWIAIGPTVQAAVDSIQPAAAAKKIQVVTEIADTDEPVFADPERLQQVLWNLLTNAVKFTEEGGTIRIDCGRVGAREQISVSDTGEGVAPEFIPFIFERFTQADASRTRKHGGLGLGLAIVRHIVESHGGTVIARSKGKGGGATFIIQLPIPGIQPPQTTPHLNETASLHGLRVMLVEDEFDTREMIAEGLEQSGATVLLAASGLEALRVMARQKPDVIVSDIGMPGMDGFELMRRIRSEYPSGIRTIPAVALTAFAGREYEEQSRDAGYQAHLVKPVTLMNLVNTIAALAGSTPL
ncbi:MAG TPA: ATP-binding protein [Terriglobia bacterium]|jgi:signal transduction histidine kinase/ActR/RegA family two-component response regulator